ncbi:MAG: glutamate 5-kinase [Firmicutes bacterium]|nr:glutamate 5-kinase [Bacillota bacterium]
MGKSQRRVVLKVGSSSLVDHRGELDLQRVAWIAGEAAALWERGAAPLIVSSGAVAAGRTLLRIEGNAVSLAVRQAAAAVGQSLLVQAYADALRKKGIAAAQALLSRGDFDHRKRYVHLRNTLELLLNHRVIPIVNENDTVDVEELRFGDNDLLAALCAQAIDAQLLVLFTDVDGLYDRPPQHPEAQRIARVSSLENLSVHVESHSRFGTGGMASKLRAAALATSSGIETRILKAGVAGLLARSLAGEPVGTVIEAQPSMLNARKRWVAYASKAHGSVWIDDGAALALQSGKSLLLAGVRQARGTFRPGDVIQVVTAERAIAKGMTNYASDELAVLLLEDRPATSLPEVIHRDNLVLLSSTAEGGLQEA